jgi:hypothetical protein
MTFAMIYWCRTILPRWGCGFLWMKELGGAFILPKYIMIQLAVVAERSGAHRLFTKCFGVFGHLRQREVYSEHLQEIACTQRCTTATAFKFVLFPQTQVLPPPAHHPLPSRTTRVGGGGDGESSSYYCTPSPPPPPPDLPPPADPAAKAWAARPRASTTDIISGCETEDPSDTPPGTNFEKSVP